MIKLSLDFNLLNDSYYFYERLLVILFSIITSLILVGYVLYSDRKSKEPVKNIVICLLSGILTIALASYLEGIAAKSVSGPLLTYICAFIEEASKIAIFLLFIFDNKHYDDIYDGIVYMMLIALSFAGLENVMYAFTESTISKSISLALIRDFTTIPLHVICGIVIGYFMSLSSFSKDKTQKYKNLCFALLIPGLIHGTYNLFMSIFKNYDDYFSVLLFETLPILLIMLILIYTAVKLSKKNQYLNNIYITDGTYDNKHKYLMTKSEYNGSSNRSKRIIMYEKTSLKGGKQ